MFKFLFFPKHLMRHRKTPVALALSAPCYVLKSCLLFSFLFFVLCLPLKIVPALPIHVTALPGFFFFFFLGCSTIKHPLHCTLLRRQFGPRVACGASLVSQRWLSFSLSLFIVCRSRAHIFCLLRSPFLLSFFIFCSQLRFYMSACCTSH